MNFQVLKMSKNFISRISVSLFQLQIDLELCVHFNSMHAQLANLKRHE